MKKAITAGRLRALPLHLSADCCDFVNSMLEPNASKRPSASALLAHPFVARNMGAPVPKAPALGPPRTLSTRGDSVSSTMDSFWSSQALISKQARQTTRPCSLPACFTGIMTMGAPQQLLRHLQSEPCQLSFRARICVIADLVLARRWTYICSLRAAQKPLSLLHGMCQRCP